LILFITADNQFGFKKGLSCSHAVFSVRTIIDRFVNGGSTVNLCAIDLSKAFDKVNLHALYIKLMRRHIPVELLETLEQWLNNCWTCVKWKAVLSCFLRLILGSDKVQFYHHIYLPFIWMALLTVLVLNIISL
jgi:hypothetical protein